jgi:diguanylate cyclase (GGDEF)-like protein/putative nucleotidyltransferase with HDIG domain
MFPPRAEGYDTAMPNRRDPRFGELRLSNYELLEASGEAFYALDGEWRFTFVNERAEQLLQRPAAELLGRNLWEEFPDAIDSVLHDEFHGAVSERRPVEFLNRYEPLEPEWFSVRAVPHADGLLVFFRPMHAQPLVEAEARALAAQDRALRKVATAVARGSDLDELLQLVASTTGELLGADAVGLLRLDPDGPGARLVAAWSSGGPLIAAGTHFADVGQLAIEPVLRGRQPSIWLSYEQDSDATLAKLGYRCAIAAALQVDGRIWGTLIVASMAPDALTDEEQEQLQRFAELLELAVSRIEDRQRLADEAARDSLTGLLNHRTFHERLADEVQRAYRHSRPLAVALIDVDEFKTVNDTFGHQQGDQLLTQLADSFREQARIEDITARLGGDEFALLLPDTTKDQAAVICQRLREAFELVDTQPVPPVTLSVGITDLADALTADRMVRLADGALYWSKEHGRDHVCVYDPDVVRDLSAHERARHLARSQTLLGLRALARAIDAKDPSTRRHSDRVAHLAELLAEQLDWHPHDIALLKEAALLHDVGKLAVPDAILLKPDRLTQEEYDQVKTHAALGADIVDEVLTARQVEWILHHHERPDGHGYPHGLREHQIPTGAALIALADSFDVMTATDRPYQAAKTTADALRECRTLTGRQFTAEAVSALQAVIADRRTDDEDSVVHAD